MNDTPWAPGQWEISEIGRFNIRVRVDAGVHPADVLLIASAPEMSELLEAWVNLHAFPHTPADIFALADRTTPLLARIRGEM